MARIPRHIIDQVRDRTDLGEVVERHVRLQRRGNSLVGLCPFHQEKSPSFHVVQHKRIYHCFGCGAGGDCFRFLMELEGLSFIEAVKELAGAVGIIIEERELTPQERQKLRLRASLHDVLEATASYWQGVLWTRPEGAMARAYLEGRDISKETAATWRLGYAPEGWTTTVDHLQREGFPLAVIAEAGLAKPKRSGQGHYDTFRDRIIIPITDDRGRVIAFGARLMRGEGPKYLNSPETPLYHKSSVLYGLHNARRAIQKKDRIVVVEGYFDVISMHQGGFEETVATCGTALTTDHLGKLRRLSRNVLALFDSDEAGARAAERSLPLFLAAEMNAFRIERPGAKDPDEIIREQGAEAMEALLRQQEGLLDWVIERRVGTGLRNGVRRSRQAMAEEMIGLLASTEDIVVITRVANRLNINPTTFTEDVRKARLQRHGGPPAHRDPLVIVQGMRHEAPSMDEPPPIDLPPDYEEPPPGEHDDAPWEEPSPPPPATWTPTRDMVHLLWLLVHRHEEVVGISRGVAPSPWSNLSGIGPVIDKLIEGEQVPTLLDDVTDPNIRRTLMAVTTRQQLYESKEAALGMACLMDRMITPPLEAEVSQLSREAQTALRVGDAERQATALARRIRLRKQIKGMKLALRRGNPENWLAVITEHADG